MDDFLTNIPSRKCMGERKAFEKKISSFHWRYFSEKLAPRLKIGIKFFNDLILTSIYSLHLIKSFLLSVIIISVFSFLASKYINISSSSNL